MDGSNAGALPGGASAAWSCRQRRTAAGAMGGYELVRSDDAAAAGPPDLELGGSGSCNGGGVSAKSRPPSSPPSQGGARQRLVSLDVFRGITVLK
ncbi:Os02g0526201 [Oryza sativa Japonica Group]|uniref:Os02g0526201 protein n=2 Tax=Oryza sativa subsp. japonica TaxID=39947 RepID=Q6H796_ORYSJ|nr:hypothetical protein [Oryza sativa Japonica Group]BAD25403.1 hypothetical protein [Oryza sativa Japonica Group]BAH91723.1 Os02g0526201 [Oryza sativa Japonica Group]|eukprot:NP_001172994.1 Os02g0526201 [Oryza sativa Japonica Group]